MIHIVRVTIIKMRVATVLIAVGPWHSRRHNADFVAMQLLMDNIWLIAIVVRIGNGVRIGDGP